MRIKTDSGNIEKSWTSGSAQHHMIPISLSRSLSQALNQPTGHIGRRGNRVVCSANSLAGEQSSESYYAAFSSGFPPARSVYLHSLSSLATAPKRQARSQEVVLTFVYLLSPYPSQSNGSRFSIRRCHIPGASFPFCVVSSSTIRGETRFSWWKIASY